MYRSARKSNHPQPYSATFYTNVPLAPTTTRWFASRKERAEWLLAERLAKRIGAPLSWEDPDDGFRTNSVYDFPND